MHKKAHDSEAFEKRGELLIARGLRIFSRELGLSGQCDIVEFHLNENGIKLFGYDEKWKPVPVEYKHGAPKENNADELQLCAQAVCLEEMLQTKIPVGYLYYGERRRRSKVEFTEDLRETVKKAAKEMHELFQRGEPGIDGRLCGTKNRNELLFSERSVFSAGSRKRIWECAA